MCGQRNAAANGLGALYGQGLAQGAVQSEGPPEHSLAKAFKDDLNVDINPQALRMFIRTRWSRISTLAHKIHEA